MMRFPLAVSLLALAGCASASRRGSGPEPLRLCIQNNTVGYGTLVAHAGLVRFDVMSGQQVCKPLTDINTNLTVVAQTTSGGANGPLTFRASVPAGGARCWRWRLTNTQASQIDLTPCDVDDSGDTTTTPGGGRRR